MNLIENLQTSLLADDANSIDTVAQWYYDQWLKHRSNSTYTQVKDNVAHFISRLGPPLIVLAKIDDQLVGAAQLKIREMSIFPEYKYWVGGVYIDTHARGLGVAAKLVQEVIDQARNASISTLYLQTQQLNGGLYAKLGFEPLEQVNYQGYEVLVMKCVLN